MNENIPSFINIGNDFAPLNCCRGTASLLIGGVIYETGFKRLR